jgi:hypothetical protein
VATLRIYESDISGTAEMREQLWFAGTIVDKGGVFTTPIEMVVNIVTKAY